MSNTIAPRPPLAPSEMTALQKHVAFFDENEDGVIEFGEGSARGQRVGLPDYVADPVMAITLLDMAKRTSGRSDRIEIRNVTAKGGSEVFAPNGKLDEAAFARLWDEFDTNQDGLLSNGELGDLIVARSANLKDRARLEIAWRLLLLVASDARADDSARNGAITRFSNRLSDGINDVLGRAPADRSVAALSRGRLCSFFDGTLFYDLAVERDRKAVAADPSAVNRARLAEDLARAEAMKF